MFDLLYKLFKGLLFFLGWDRSGTLKTNSDNFVLSERPPSKILGAAKISLEIPDARTIQDYFWETSRMSSGAKKDAL